MKKQSHVLGMCVTDSKKGTGMGGPGGPAAGGAPGNVQDPINALQTLARQGICSLLIF